MARGLGSIIQGEVVVGEIHGVHIGKVDKRNGDSSAMEKYASYHFTLLVIVEAEAEAKEKVVIFLDGFDEGNGLFFHCSIVDLCGFELAVVESDGPVFLTDNMTELMLVDISIYIKGSLLLATPNKLDAFCSE
eukprot:12862369-Ditylum_brightwellii.AAC.1